MLVENRLFDVEDVCVEIGDVRAGISSSNKESITSLGYRSTSLESETFRSKISKSVMPYSVMDMGMCSC